MKTTAGVDGPGQRTASATGDYRMVAPAAAGG